MGFAVIGDIVVHSGHRHGCGSNLHITVGDTGNNDLRISGDIKNVEAAHSQAHLGGTYVCLCRKSGNAIFQGDGHAIRKRSIYDEVLRSMGLSIVNGRSGIAGDGHFDNGLRLEVRGVGFGFVDVVTVLVGDIDRF